jgi:hypothetical protein
MAVPPHHWCLFAFEKKHLFEVVGATAQQQSNDQSEQTKDRREDLNNQNLDETVNALEPILGFVSISRNLQRRVRSVGQRSAGAVDSDTDTADQVAHADKRAAPEKSISGVVVASRVCGVTANLSQLGGEDDAHDDSVDGDDLAENNRDQVLGADSWRLDTTTEDRSSGNEDSPVFLVSAFVPSCSRFRSFLSCR